MLLKYNQEDIGRKKCIKIVELWIKSKSNPVSETSYVAVMHNTATWAPEKQNLSQEHQLQSQLTIMKHHVSDEIWQSIIKLLKISQYSEAFLPYTTIWG